jgi:hypothetical protein
MSGRQRILDRIRKCLRLAESPEPNEAAAALRQAQALMAKHGVSEDEIRMADVREARAKAGRAQRPPVWIVYLANVVAEAFGVEVYLSREPDKPGNFVFCGVQPSEEIARYAFDVLRRRCTVARQQFYRRTRGKRRNRIARADTYAAAWVYGVQQQVADFAQAVPAIVGQYLRERHPGLQMVSGRNRVQSGYRKEAAAGMCDGASVELHHGVNGSEPARRIGEEG